MSDIRVLVVEDEPVASAAHAAYVGRLEGFTLAGTAPDGQSALRLLTDFLASGEPVELVLLDMNLPGVHGLKACRQITQESPEIKVIMFTAGNDPEVRQRAFAAGAAAFVDKLASTDDLLSAVKGLDNRE